MSYVQSIACCVARYHRDHHHGSIEVVHSCKSFREFDPCVMRAIVRIESPQGQSNNKRRLFFLPCRRDRHGVRRLFMDPHAVAHTSCSHDGKQGPRGLCVARGVLFDSSAFRISSTMTHTVFFCGPEGTARLLVAARARLHIGATIPHTVLQGFSAAHMVIHSPTVALLYYLRRRTTSRCPSTVDVRRPARSFTVHGSDTVMWFARSFLHDSFGLCTCTPRPRRSSHFDGLHTRIHSSAAFTTHIVICGSSTTHAHCSTAALSWQTSGCEVKAL